MTHTFIAPSSVALVAGPRLPVRAALGMRRGYHPQYIARTTICHAYGLAEAVLRSAARARVRPDLSARATTPPNRRWKLGFRAMPVPSGPPAPV